MAKIPNVYKDSKTQKYYFKADFDLGDSGKRTQILRRGFDTQREAKEALDYARLNPEVLKKNPKKKSNNSKSISFGNFYDNIFLPFHEGRVKQSTFVSNINSLVKAIDYFRDYPIDSITRVDIFEFRNTMLSRKTRNGTKYSADFLNRMVFWIRQVLDLAVDYEYITVNVATNIKKLPVQHKEVEFWTIDEFKKFNAHLPQNELDDIIFATAIYVLFFTGLRIGELLALQWQDIDFNKKTLSVRKNLVVRRKGKSYGSACFSLTTPKTKSSMRKIGIDDKTLEILQNWKQIQSERGFFHDGYIFQFEGEFLSDSFFRYKMIGNCKKSGIKKIKIHSLRHSHASFLIYRGVDVLHIQKRLGHSNIKTTLGLYGHLYPNYESDLMLILNNENI